MKEFDLNTALDELINPTGPPKDAAVKSTAETPTPISLESTLSRLPPEG